MFSEHGKTPDPIPAEPYRPGSHRGQPVFTKTDTHSMWPRILPFAAYMACIGISALLPIDSSLDLWLYPVKILVVLGLLIFFWSSYQELQRPIILSGKEAALAVSVGLVVYILWVRMDWSWAMQGKPTGYHRRSHSGSHPAIRSVGSGPGHGRIILAVISHTMNHQP